MLIPYRFHITQDRQPTANWILLGLLGLVFLWEQTADDETIMALALTADRPLTYITSSLLHADLMHLIGNGIFLWVFGNAICAKMGQWWYVLLFFGLAIIADIAHVLFDGGPAIGASGAINGLVGFAAVVFTWRTIDVLFLWIPFVMRSIEVRAVWIILYWFAWDVFGALVLGGSTAYVAHIGGLFGGVAIALLAIRLGWIEREAEILWRPDQATLASYGPRAPATGYRPPGQATTADQATSATRHTQRR